MKRGRRIWGSLLVVLPMAGAFACGSESVVDNGGPVSEWRNSAGSPAGRHYSPLTQITPENVGELEVAWVHHHGDVSDGSDGNTRTSFNATPIMVRDTLYFCTGLNRVFAVDAETGEQRWIFDPLQRMNRIEGPYTRACRGVAYWEDEAADHARPCARRILTGTLDSQLIAIDAESGRACEGFGAAGRVALREGLGEAEPWEYYPTSAPLVIGDVVVIGALVADNLRSNAPAGVVRGFDVRTGELRWAFDPVPPGWRPPHPGEGGPRYTAGTPNVWAPMSGDPDRRLVFVPMGNASPDYFAGARRGLDHYSSSLVALDAQSGKLAWSFQTVHHDVWDYDLAPQPALWDFPRDGARIPAVVQATKMGLVFLLDRQTGEPLFPLEERPVPERQVPGEVVTPTQPFPTHVAPLHPQRLDPEDAWGFTRWDRDACREAIASLRSEGIYTPPSFEGSLHYPGSAGGANWGGVALDPQSGVMFVNTLRMPSVVRLIPRAEYEQLDPADFAYPNEIYPMEGTPFAVTRGPLLSPLGAPCNPPPWGLMSAVDLASGEILWESVLGSTRDQAPFPMWLEFGSPNLGGPLATAGGLVFIGATTDKFLRAYHAATGEIVWRQRLPYTASANPLSYRLGPDGRQYLVIAAGGHGWSEPGDALVAFALP